MTNMPIENLQQRLDFHNRWLNDPTTGERLVIEGATFSDYPFPSNVNLTKAVFRHCHFEDVFFHFANLDATEFIGCTFLHISFLETTLDNSKIHTSTLENVKIGKCKGIGMHMQDTSFINTRVIHTDISFSECIGCHFSEFTLRNATMLNGKVLQATFLESMFVESKLNFTNLSHTTFNDTLIVDTDLSNTTLDYTTLAQCSLSNTYLFDVQGEQTVFKQVHFRNTDFKLDNFTAPTFNFV